MPKPRTRQKPAMAPSGALKKGNDQKWTDAGPGTMTLLGLHLSGGDDWLIFAILTIL